MKMQRQREESPNVEKPETRNGLLGYDLELLKLLADSIYQTQMVGNPRQRAAMVLDRLKKAGYHIAGQAEPL